MACQQLAKSAHSAHLPPCWRTTACFAPFLQLEAGGNKAGEGEGISLIYLFLFFILICSLPFSYSIVWNQNWTSLQSHGWFSLLVISVLIHHGKGSYCRFRVMYRRGVSGLGSIQCCCSEGLKWERGREKRKSSNERNLRETKNCCHWGAMHFLQGVLLPDNLWDGGTRYLNLCLNTGEGRRK